MTPRRSRTAPWLLLIHSIPPRPNYLRVKIGRRLQKLGAVAVKNSVYALPDTGSAREDLQWIANEIAADGGEATLCEARFIAGQTDAAIQALFRTARQRDYLQVARSARRVVQAPLSTKRRPRAEATLGRLTKRLEEIVAIDHFGAPGRAEVEALLRAAQSKLRPPPPAPRREPLPLRELRGRTWVTRKGIHVDRIASGWLIRRFIDPAAKLKYVEPKGYVPSAGELRFDMFDAEFTHEGALCTFEVLLARLRNEDPALRHLGELVHDADLRDARFGHPETSGFTALITGIGLQHRDDDARLAAGSAALDALYRALQQRGRK
ncbi:MAG TPA: chromate resistance protein ChrB domain-containing protein [Polyangia bacterium]|nr:chromate resistance protein ChrB domain-containing protein [Polyangia bacterium]